MPCHDCAIAATQTHHGFSAGCIGCCARAAARSPQYARVRDAGKLDRDYRALLEQFKLTHEQVKQASWLDAAAKAPLVLEP